MTANSTNNRRASFFRLATGLLMLILCGFAKPANASLPDRLPASFTSIAAAPGGGFWIQVNTPDGKGYTVAVDGAPQYESVPEAGTLISIPGRNAYWVVSVFGHIYARGGAPELCEGYLPSCSGYNTTERITGAAASPNGQGFWAVDEHRHVWTAGDVISYGDVTNDNQTPTGIVATPSGRGYYIVMDDGGVFSFGDAVFFGSTGGRKPGGHDVTGLALSLDFHGNVNGYWMLAEDGAIYTFGDAAFLGNGGVNSEYTVSVVSRPGGHSYAWVLANGQYGLSSIPSRVTISSQSGTVWSPAGGYPYPGTALQLVSPSGNLSQQWYVWPTTSDGKTVQLVNVATGLCADVTQYVNPPYNFYLIQFECKGETGGWDNQRFTMITDDAGHVQFAPVSPIETLVGAQTADSPLTLVNRVNRQGTSWVLTRVESPTTTAVAGPSGPSD